MKFISITALILLSICGGANAQVREGLPETYRNETHRQGLTPQGARSGLPNDLQSDGTVDQDVIKVTEENGDTTFRAVPDDFSQGVDWRTRRSRGSAQETLPAGRR